MILWTFDSLLFEHLKNICFNHYFCITICRFLAIWWPLKLQITKRRAKLIIVGIWVIACTITIPWAMFFQQVRLFPSNPNIMLCREIWPEGTDGQLYFILVNLLSCYIMPFILISVCYILIWVKVCLRYLIRKLLINEKLCIDQ